MELGEKVNSKGVENMKKVKFLKTFTFEGKPIWYKNCEYEVEREIINNIGRRVYVLMSEDLIPRGIDALFMESNNLCVITEIENKQDKVENIVEEEKKVEKIISKKSSTKKRKNTKK